MATLTPVPITPPAGVVKTESNRIAEGRWIDSDKVRFIRGRPQKLGGWLRQTTAVTAGLPRTVHGWRDLLANNFIAVGTYKKLYVYDTALAQNDITPFRATGTLATDPFTTINGSTTVTVTHLSHGLTEGATITFSGASTFNNITPNGTFVVLLVSSPNVYTFTAATTANASGSGGGASVAYTYEINIGTELAAFGLGWGVGGWGLSTWGTPRTVSSGSVGSVIEPRVWSIDHFGKILLATYNTGSIYTFDPTALQPWPRAQIITDSPSTTRALVVTPERFVFSLGENMVVASSTQGDFTIWTPASNNTAFTRTLTEGSRLVCGRVLAPFITLVWTDAALYSFQYTGSQFVYNSALVATNCGLIGPNAAVTAQGLAYWMGSDQFWMYNGSVIPIPNSEDIRHFVFTHLPANISFQSFAVYNPVYNEIYFGYADGTGNSFPNRYVLYSIADQCWATGSLTRVGGMHFAQGDTRPIFSDGDGFLYLHETGNDDNLSAMNWTLTLAPVAMQEGLRQMDLEAILFDFFEQSGDIDVTVNTYDRLNDATVEDTESDVVAQGANPYTEFRVSGRYVGMILSQTGTGTYFRMGKPAAFVRQSSKRS